MRKILLSLFLIASFPIFAQLTEIFDPNMTITEFGLVDSPLGEEVDKIIDADINTKFLDFELADGMGFTVNLGGISAVAVAMDLTTANDFEVRDPIDFTILGSNDGASFSSVASGTIPCITDRFETRRFEFSNSDAYSYYRVDFSGPCDPSGGTGIPSIQCAEVQLFEMELGIEDNSLQGVALYPNPASDIVYIENPSQIELTAITVFDLNGKVVRNMDGNEFDVQGLPGGIYFVQIRSQELQTTQKLIVR